MLRISVIAAATGSILAASPLIAQNEDPSDIPMETPYGTPSPDHHGMPSNPPRLGADPYCGSPNCPVAMRAPDVEHLDGGLVERSPRGFGYAPSQRRHSYPAGPHNSPQAAHAFRPRGQAPKSRHHSGRYLTGCPTPGC
jgi:hypothetical protein